MIRTSFFGLLGMGLAGTLLAGCLPVAPTPTKKPVTTNPTPEQQCQFVASVRNGAVIDVPYGGGTYTVEFTSTCGGVSAWSFPARIGWYITSWYSPPVGSGPQKGWVTVQATSELPNCSGARVKIDSSTTPFVRLLEFQLSYRGNAGSCSQ